MNVLRLSAEQYQALQEKRKRPSLVEAGRLYRPKYGNQATDGYASKREAKRAELLKLMEQAGEIAELKEQVRYELVPAQYDGERLLERAVFYVADFRYRIVATGETVTEDCKGVRTPAYIIKRKLMLAKHGIKISEV